MGAEYYDDEQKRMKLDRTICLYDGEPYLVRADAYARNIVALYHLKRGLPKYKDVDYREENFNYSAMPLGYLNWGDYAHYATRVPERQNSQGLSRFQIIFRPRTVIHDDFQWFTSEAMRNTIKGVYPSLDEAFNQIGNLPKQKKSIAFSRYFALEAPYRDAVFLQYRGRLVGHLEDKKTKTFKLFRTKPMSLVKIAAQREGLLNVST